MSCKLLTFCTFFHCTIKLWQFLSNSKLLHSESSNFVPFLSHGLVDVLGKLAVAVWPDLQAFRTAFVDSANECRGGDRLRFCFVVAGTGTSATTAWDPPWPLLPLDPPLDLHRCRTARPGCRRRGAAATTPTTSLPCWPRTTSTTRPPLLRPPCRPQAPCIPRPTATTGTGTGTATSTGTGLEILVRRETARRCPCNRPDPLPGTRLHRRLAPGSLAVAATGTERGTGRGTAPRTGPAGPRTRRAPQTGPVTERRTGTATPTRHWTRTWRRQG